MPKPPLLYRLLLTLLTPVLVVVIGWQAWKNRSKRFAMQRLGIGFTLTTQRPVWIHCASVGEVNAAKALIEGLRAKQDCPPLLVSTATPTGADAVLQQGWNDIPHVFLPLDFSWTVVRAFNAIEPRALLLMETEIWPNLIHQAHRQGVPVVIFNGRLSPRTMNAPQWLRPVYQQTLAKVSTVLAKSSEDAKRFVSLGAAADRVQTLGNLKFAAAAQAQATQANPIDQPFWLAASTHENEEQQLCQALLREPKGATALLLIAPRHPKRSAKIQQQLQALGIEFAVRSKSETIEVDTQVYLADTLGEMQGWLQHAQLVFMGGSLVDVGGHNLLEPAAAGKPIISGPYLHNFTEEAALLSEVGALEIRDNANDVINSVTELLSNAPARQTRGLAGQRAALQQATVLSDYLKALGPYISAQQ
ncbi:MAG: 3-deoxy-D-manno-octulosonic acid transferase [Granulosicoccaceae bacterium]